MACNLIYFYKGKGPSIHHVFQFICNCGQPQTNRLLTTDIRVYLSLWLCVYGPYVSWQGLYKCNQRFTKYVFSLLTRISICYWIRLLFANIYGISFLLVIVRLLENRTYYAVTMSGRLSVCPRFPDFFSTCFEIAIWNLVYTFSRWHDMSSVSCNTIGSPWPNLQPKVAQTLFVQSWPLKSRWILHI